MIKPLRPLREMNVATRLSIALLAFHPLFVMYVFYNSQLFALGVPLFELTLSLLFVISSYLAMFIFLCPVLSTDFRMEIGAYYFRYALKSVDRLTVFRILTVFIPFEFILNIICSFNSLPATFVFSIILSLISVFSSFLVFSEQWARL